MTWFVRKHGTLAEAIKEEKRKLDVKKERVEEIKDEFHKIKPMAGDILGGYVEVILKQRAKLRDV